MTTALDHERATGARQLQQAAPDPKRFRALAVIAVAQLMVVLDASVVVIALPSAQQSLHISIANRQWMLTAYTLAFAGLLLLGGRIADYLGRKRMFVISLVGFAGGLGARRTRPELGDALQRPGAAGRVRRGHGARGALAAHRRLHRAQGAGHGRSRSTAGSPVPARRSASSSAGRSPQYASWRWTLLINVPIALVAAVAAVRVVTESRSPVRHGYDVPGAVTVTLGLLALVYGFTTAATDGWGSPTTLALLALRDVLIGAFVVIEQRTAHPLLPLRVILDRNRGGSFLASLLVGVAHARHVPVPHLLLPGHAALLGDEDRPRVPALLGRDRPRRRARRGGS